MLSPPPPLDHDHVMYPPFPTRPPMIRPHTPDVVLWSCKSIDLLTHKPLSCVCFKWVCVTVCVCVCVTVCMCVCVCVMYRERDTVRRRREWGGRGLNYDWIDTNVHTLFWFDTHTLWPTISFNTQRFVEHHDDKNYFWQEQVLHVFLYHVHSSVLEQSQEQNQKHPFPTVSLSLIPAHHRASDPFFDPPNLFTVLPRPPTPHKLVA